jgi:hypothetical protein
MSINYISDAVRAIIGARSDWAEVHDAVEAGEVRRFFQAAMDTSPRYWDADYAASTRAGAPVAPPGFPIHTIRRRPDETADPLDRPPDHDPEFDGQSRVFRPGLPRVPVPLGGSLNGGYEYEFFSYAKIGDRIQWRSRYRDIYQRDGKTGPLIFVLIEDEYRTADGRPLLKATNTAIMR